jgi:MFS family permease
VKQPTAIKFVILLGFVSLFADMTYEGARSITGQYLALLGASGAVVGTVAGFGELIGYAFRLVSGYWADKSGRYWLLTIVGYIINLLAVPLLALAGSWEMACTLIIAERFGKALRSPAKDAMLSYATKEVGRGWGFGLHEAMDQIGAVLGPLLMSCMLFFKNSYQESFALLLIPALCALAVLFVSYKLYPNPQDLEEKSTHLHTKGFTKTFWLYIAAISCVATGYVDFPLIAYHFKKADALTDAWIPISFAVAMGASGIAALIFGRLFDKYGMSVLIIATALSSLFVPCVFYTFPILGIILWGTGLGTQESIMRAVVANLVPTDKRGTAYGLLNAFFGIFWFLGSAFIGYLYDVSIVSLVLFSLAAQIAALPLLFIVSKRTRGPGLH